jgi:DNA-binding CsgD family transcriptional regulator
LLGLEAQLALLHQLTGNVDEALACCERGLARLRDPWLREAAPAEPGEAESGSGESGAGQSGAGRPPTTGLGSGRPGRAIPVREAWVGGYLRLIGGLALFRRPGSERECGSALRSALTAWHRLGDVMGTAYAVEALGWLAAQREQFERAAWLLGAADQLWSRTGRRLSGIALMEECRQQAARATRRSLGERRYAAAYAHGGALSLDAVVRDAVDETGEPAAWRAGYLVSQDEAAPGSAGGAGLLTRREQEIAELVASGLSNREIAARLFISKRTVDAHVDHIFSKLEISSRVQLTVLLQALGGRAHVAGV